MTFQFQTFARQIAVLMAVAAFAAPTALASDRRAPDTRDAALAAHQSAAPIDLRSPDTRDAGRAVRTTSPGSPAIDLRSPDTRDVANGRSPALSKGPVEVTVVGRGGFHWSDAGIGAGAGAGFVLVLLGTSLLIRSARTETQPV